MNAVLTEALSLSVENKGDTQMKKLLFVLIVQLSVVAVPAVTMAVTASTAELATGFAQPPESDRPWVYWWWLDGAASKEGITRDLEEMRRQGIGGVLLLDAGQGDRTLRKDRRS